MSPSLNDLPDVCLLAVFQYLSLLELLRTIRLVNTRWSGLLPAEMVRRRSLVLVDYRMFKLSQLQLDQYQSPLIEHVKQDDGQTPWTQSPQIDSRNVLNRNTRYKKGEHCSIYNQMQPEMITTLVDNLPRISNLTVVQRIVNIYSLDQITRLIDHWRDHLITLKLDLYLQDLFPETGFGIQDNQRAQIRAQTVALIDSINRAPLLRHLTLSLNNFIAFNDPPFTAPLTILSQLSTLYSESGRDFMQYLYHALASHATGNRNLQIGTKNWIVKSEDLLRIDPEFCRRFSYVEVSIPRTEIFDRLNLFCARFSSLVHLKIYAIYFVLAISKLGRCLSQLNQLVHLDTTLFADPREENLPEHLQELSADQIVPVASVRLLTATIHITAHSGTERLLLHRVFPNVQVLSISCMTRKCKDCGFIMKYVNGAYQNPAQMRQCAQLARQPFRRFPRLHTIEIDAKDSWFLSHMKMRLITRDEL